MIGKPHADERGMTGIGVLILFIALVLVAAIASGLILDTAGFLQNTAQDTGEQSTSEVSDRVSVLSASGEVVENGDANVVRELSMTVYRSPGAGDVDLQHASIEFFGPDGTAFLIHEDEYDAADDSDQDFVDDLGYFEVEAVKDDDGSIPVLNSRDDRASMVIPIETEDGETPTTSGETEQNGGLEVLNEGDSATLRITTQHGATTTEIVNVPESLAGYEDSTVML